MTSTPGNPGSTDFEGKAVPPYEGRRETADVDVDTEGEEKLHRDGANVGAATGPVETDDTRRAPEPADTPRGAVALPADERPAADTPSGDSGPASTDPAHYAGTTRGEDVSEDQHDQGDGEKAGGA